MLDYRCLILTAACVQLLYSGPVFAEETDSTPQFVLDTNRVKAQIDRIAIEEGVPSISIAVARGQSAIWAYATGEADKESGRPATTDTPYRIASVSKPVTAVAIMLLAESGVIELDAPANDYLGEQKVVADAGDVDDVTVRRLLSHRAGLPLHYNLIHAAESYERRDLDETIAKYGRAMLPPGLTHRYSNVGYAVLERIIEQQSSLSYDAFLHEHFFDPLGMTHSGVVTAPVHPPLAAIPYTRAGDRYDAYDMDTRAAGGVYMSASDLVRFGRFFSDALDGRSEVLSATRANEMLEAQTPLEPGRREWYVLGWVHELRGENLQYDTIYHLGSTPGVRAELWIYPQEDLIVATLVNEMSWPPLNRAREAVVAALIPELALIPYPAIQFDAALQKRWVGEINLGEEGRVPVELDAREPLNPSVTVDGRAVRILSAGPVDDGFYQISTSPARLETEDVQRQPFELGFLVRVEEAGLVGYVSANRVPTRERDSGNFAFPVRLVTLEEDSR